MLKLTRSIKNPLFNQKGQGLVEYALILVLIAVALMAAVTTLKTNVSCSYSKIGSAIQ